MDENDIVELVAKARLDVHELIHEIKEIRSAYDGAQAASNPKSTIILMRNENRNELRKKFNSLKDNIQNIIDLPDGEEIEE